MEELKTAIGAMKQAEEALAKQGFILRWKVRVKANRGFFRNMVSRLIADTAAPATEIKEIPVRVPETPQAMAQEEVDEAQPVTSLDTQSAASYLGISVAGVYDLIKRGRISAHGKPGARWFLVEELDRYRHEREKRRQDKNP